MQGSMGKKIIDSNLGQATERLVTFIHMDRVKVRYRIKFDFYKKQSWAIAEAFNETDLRWNEIATYPVDEWWCGDRSDDLDVAEAGLDDMICWVLG